MINISLPPPPPPKPPPPQSAQRRWFFWRRTLEEHYFVGKSRSLEESGGRKTHMALTAAPEEAADMRVVQCLIHASAVSDSGSAAPSSSFEVMAKLRADREVEPRSRLWSVESE